MTAMTAMLPVRLEVPVNHSPRELPSEIRERLDVTPAIPSAEELQARAARQALIRDAHIEAVKERATRDLQRSAEAAARRRRADHAQAQRIIHKLDAATKKTEMRRQEQQDKRDSDKAKRDSLASAVSNKRTTMTIAALKKGVEDASRAVRAVEKRDAIVQAVSDKGSTQVKHALSVVATTKEQQAAEAAMAAERLAAKVESAEVRRQHEASLRADALQREAEKSKRVAAARQAMSVELEQKRLIDDAQMQKAAKKREELLSTIKDAAAVFNEHAKDVADAARAQCGTPAEKKKALYEKMVSAEVGRELALRKKAAGGSVPDYHPEVISVRMGNNDATVPSRTLLRRLTTCPQTLLATSAARQLGAFTRRELASAEQHARSVKHVARLAAAAKRRSTRRAATLAKISAREARSEAMLDAKERAHAKLLVREMALAAMVAANRDAAEAETSVKAEIYRDRLAEASERRSKALRTTAKVGVVALRSNLNRSRRAALLSVIKKNGELHQKRCMMADTIRQAELGAKVAAAKESAAKREKPNAVE